MIQISCLALKSGNAVILKGGKEASCSLKVLYSIIQQALIQSEMPLDSVQLILSREEVDHLLKMDKDIDLVIPRGSRELVQYIKEHTRYIRT